MRRRRVLRGLKIRAVRLQRTSSLRGSFSKVVLPNNRDAIRKGLLRSLGVFRPLGRGVRSNVPILTAYTKVVLLTSSVTRRSRACFRAVPVAIGQGTCNHRVKDFRAGTRTTNVNRVPVAFVHTPFMRSIRTSTSKGAPRVLDVMRGHVIKIGCGGRVTFTFRPRLSRSAQVRRTFLKVVE